MNNALLVLVLLLGLSILPSSNPAKAPCQPPLCGIPPIRG